MSDEKRLDRIERVVERNADAIADLKDRVAEVTSSVGRLEKKIDSVKDLLDMRFARLEKELSWKMIAGFVVGGTMAGLFTMATLLLRAGTGI
ncbi:hypothetical protein [Thioalkalivibrio sp. HK1]|uniref:hypothetical protein n=1 Tax=Thioalkalivibrio sp. HK1 TaxID=1469245 RepID=UPI0012DF6DF9|nr:hypothetical protein [Thioalkalivibrio sp. HK1]